MRKLISILQRTIALTAVIVMASSNYAVAQNLNTMKKKILFVVTSHDTKGNTGEKTGFYLSEVSHPWEALTNAGYEIDFVSPKGGKAPVDGFNLEDTVNKKFWENKTYRQKIEHTMKPNEVDPSHYTAIHYAGGHGTMWDFTDNKQLSAIAAEIYENGGIVSAVCHGPAGLVNIKLSNGKYLVEGKRINAFTNEEESAVKMDKVVPYLLETKLMERGAQFEKSGLWQSHVVTDQRVITGQNPQSAKAVGEAMVTALNQMQSIARMTRYEVKKESLEDFRKVLNDYVIHALIRQDNIMAEAYFEEEHPEILWLFERWENRNALNRFGKEIPAKELSNLTDKALTKPIEELYVSDLEPLTKEDWRKAAQKTDNPITIMLFVDSKAGTEENFKEVYHIAMPQFRSEPGVITYQLSQLDKDASQFVTFEKFRNEAAFQYHLNFPPIQSVLNYLQTSIKKQPFQTGLHRLIEFSPMLRE